MSTVYGGSATDGLAKSNDRLTRLLERQLFEQVGKEGLNEQKPPTITSVCTFTRNRTQTLQRFLESYAGSARSLGRKIKLVLTDQSDQQSTRLSHVQLMQQTQRAYGIPCYYAAHDEKEQFAEQLANGADVSRELARFAICNDEIGPAAYGANRNALLLSTLGELALHAGDDTLCQLASARDYRQQLVLTSEANPLELYHLSEQEHSLLTESFDYDDVLSIHENLIGRSLHYLIERHRSEQIPVVLDRCELNFCRKLKPWRVAATCTGIVGDSNTGTAYWSLLSRGKTRESLVRSIDDYRFAMTRQLVTRSVRELTVSDRGWKGSACEALDNRSLLPPFMPVDRGEDVIFGMLIEYSLSGYFGYLPWMVNHSRTVRHCFRTQDLIESVTAVSRYSVIKYLLEEKARSHSRHLTPSENLTAIGGALFEIGSLPLDDFAEMINLMLSKKWLEQVARIEACLKQFDGQPQFWADDVNKCLSALQETIQSRRTIVRPSVGQAIGNEPDMGELQDIVKKFGALIQAWPALRDAASTLNSRGVHLARPV